MLWLATSPVRYFLDTSDWSDKHPEGAIPFSSHPDGVTVVEDAA
jgi:hypothetical protein